LRPLSGNQDCPYDVLPNMEHSELESQPGIAALLRQIPAVNELLNRTALKDIEVRVGRRPLVECTRRALQRLRDQIVAGGVTSVSLAQLEREIAGEAEAAARFSLRPVINASGVVLHTNLGRAPLAREAVEHLAEISTRYSNLEFDLDAGARGRRDIHSDRLFCQLLGAEKTLLVNNNAAAVLLALNTLAEHAEVVVSRGELIEIGGSFRIPEVCAKSGAVLREVGTTNRTRISDYAAAVNERTRVLLRVHPSNFRIVGFTARPSLEEFVALAQRHNLIAMEDLGSGCLGDLLPEGVQDEPTAAASLQAGVDVVTFSGDKLLGGPQAGILAGKREPLERIRQNPLFRALRVDKLTIAALEATMLLYLQGKRQAIPALRMIHLPKEEICRRATRLADKISIHAQFSVRVQDGDSVIGGGSTPAQSLPSALLAVTHSRHSAQELERLLRRNSPPIIARVEEGALLLDLRTVFDDQDEQLLRALEAIE
jgi:L-seryl-tRNA(Ser) seleniumtransferase